MYFLAALFMIMGNDYCKELNLAAELKSVCDDHGKETDIAESTAIFQKFGLLYRKKSPDKISLIRSAVFFNAALCREPNNRKATEDLKEICSHVSELAGAKNEQLDRISFETRNQVIKMREQAKEDLQLLDTIPIRLTSFQLRNMKTKKINIVKKIQSKITKSFLSIMDNVAKQCNKLMGTPPCAYAVVGMGSLARQEVTPYSDFEHVIILQEGVQSRTNYEEILEYFRWFTVIFQIIIINLRETIIPSVASPLLNNQNIPNGDWFFDNYTKRGISFDGMMLHACKFPLGRTQHTPKKPFITELIKPVNEMARYLQADEQVKNGYHLADILTKTCFVSGHESLYDEFLVLTKQVLDCENEQSVYQIYRQLNEDLVSYNIAELLNHLGTSTKWNIKRVMYRSTTLFVSALGRLRSIEKSSCFDIIDELLAHEHINKQVAEELSFAIAVACEIRLKTYTSKDSQDDYVGSRRFNISDNEIIGHLRGLIGEQSIGDYFLTARRLQMVLHLRGADFQNEDFHESSPEEKFETLYLLDLHNLVLAEWREYDRRETSQVHAAVCYYVAQTYSRKNEFEKALEIYDELENYFSKIDFGFRVKCIRRKAHCLCELGKHKNGLEYIKKHFSLFKSLNVNEKRVSFHALGYLKALQGDCERHLGLLNNAVISYSDALASINQSRSKSEFQRNLKTKCYYFMALSQAKLNNYKGAIESALTALAVCQETHIELSLECKCYRLLGDCYSSLKQPQEALNCFKMELELCSYHKDGKLRTNDAEISVLLDRIQSLQYVVARKM